MTGGGAIKALAVDDLYPAVVRLFRGAPQGTILDVPAGQGAFAQELLSLGYADIDCLDINEQAFRLADPRVRFRRHDVIEPLPYPDGRFDYVFSIEGIEHFENPWTFVKELCRVLKPGGRLFLTTPNSLVYKRQWAKRLFETWIATLIRNNIRKRGFPDPGVTSEEMLFGDCIIIEGRKA